MKPTLLGGNKEGLKIDKFLNPSTGYNDYKYMQTEQCYTPFPEVNITRHKDSKWPQFVKVGNISTTLLLIDRSFREIRKEKT